MLRVEKFYGARVRPNGLRFFKPDRMFAIVGPVLGLVPFKPHVYLYAIVYTWSMEFDDSPQNTSAVTNDEIGASRGRFGRDISARSPGSFATIARALPGTKRSQEYSTDPT